MLTEMSAEDAEPLTDEERAKQARSGNLLYDIFPKHVADALQEGKKIEPEKHDIVTVIFSDIVSFTDISRQLGPEKGTTAPVYLFAATYVARVLVGGPFSHSTRPAAVCDMLDRLYLRFDACAKKHSVFKVETIGMKFLDLTMLDRLKASAVLTIPFNNSTQVTRGWE